VSIRASMVRLLRNESSKTSSLTYRRSQQHVWRCDSLRTLGENNKYRWVSITRRFVAKSIRWRHVVRSSITSLAQVHWVRLTGGSNQYFTAITLLSNSINWITRKRWGRRWFTIGFCSVRLKSTSTDRRVITSGSCKLFTNRTRNKDKTSNDSPEPVNVNFNICCREMNKMIN